VNREGFPIDHDFPQLAIASDPALMREVFRSHLQPLTSPAYRIEECQLWRFRYRPGTRCILQYTLRLVEPATGREQSQWVTGLIYGEERAGRSARKFRAAEAGSEVPETFRTFAPVSFIPDLKMMVQVYPYDRRLPTLPLVLGGTPPELEREILGAFGPGDWRAEAWESEPMRYRAGLAAVVRYDVRAREAATGRSEERRFYAKVYRDEEAGERTYYVLRELWERGESGDGFTVGRPLAYLGELNTLVQEGSMGTSLEQLLIEGRETDEMVRRVARAVAAFNQDGITAPRLRLLEDQVSASKKVGRLLQWACPHLRDEVEAIVGAVAAGLRQAPVGPTHRDLKADHFLLDGDQLALLDLDSLVAADPVLDPATFLAQLESMPYRFPVTHDRLRAVAEAFAEEYFAHAPRAWRSRLPLQYADAALHVAVGFFRRQEPRWPETIAVLVEKACAALAGKSWRWETETCCR